MGVGAEAGDAAALLAERLQTLEAGLAIMKARCGDMNIDAGARSKRGLRPGARAVIGAHEDAGVEIAEAQLFPGDRRVHRARFRSLGVPRGKYRPVSPRGRSRHNAAAVALGSARLAAWRRRQLSTHYRAHALTVQ